MSTRGGQSHHPAGARRGSAHGSSRALRHLRAGVVGACIAGLVACADEPTRPRATPPPPVVPATAARGATFLCTVTVADERMTCGAPAPDTIAASAAVIIGGQDIYVRLASGPSTYDAGTETMSLDVTVQNLVQTEVGTTDGITVDGVTVFLVSDPATTQGSGVVTVANADGRGTFTGSNQPYFLYSEILEPYQISGTRTWQFAVPPTVQRFQFTAYASLPMVDENAPLLDAVWTGDVSTDWLLAGNWQGGVPVDTSVVDIPSDALLPSPNMPVLSADDTVSNLRVGAGSTLALDGHVLEITGNVDALGAVQGGALVLSGGTALLGGSLPELRITGAATLQRLVQTTGPVAVTGSLAVRDYTLSIILP